ncbi:hypothetical protein J4438_00995 [Candidatus Woesearchaeota archaeon]|nr:hypothetical protein [Candidatus Woesearchaeota archaeon]
MEEQIKVNFTRAMLVLKIRDAYKAPYHKNKFIALKKKDCEDPKVFKKFMHQYTGNWSSGSYDLQFVIKEGGYMNQPVYYTLCRFDVRDGRIVKIWKSSPYTRKTYPIWEVFSETKKKPVAKKVDKKKVVKKKSK